MLGKFHHLIGWIGLSETRVIGLNGSLHILCEIKNASNGSQQWVNGFIKFWYVFDRIFTFLIVFLHFRTFLTL
jgi:hypothetical protein